MTSEPLTAEQAEYACDAIMEDHTTGRQFIIHMAHESQSRATAHELVREFCALHKINLETHED